MDSVQILPRLSPSQVMASDVEPLEEIETWRQMVGLEELQADGNCIGMSR